MMDYIDKMMKAKRDNAFKESPQLTLGEVIDEIEDIGTHTDDGDVKDSSFDFCGAVPTGISSWRGVYSELALEYEMDERGNVVENPLDAKSLLDTLKEADGEVFTGWKGGDFTMDRSTPLWVSNPGEGFNTAVVGVSYDVLNVILLTAWIPDPFEV